MDRMGQEDFRHTENMLFYFNEIKCLFSECKLRDILSITKFLKTEFCGRKADIPSSKEVHSIVQNLNIKLKNADVVLSVKFRKGEHLSSLVPVSHFSLRPECI